LHLEMSKYVDGLEFEKADAVYKTIQQIEKTMEGQSVDKPLGVDKDAIGLFRQGDEITVVLLLFRDGRLSNTRHYHFSRIAQNDEELLESFLLQHYDQEVTIPAEILLPIKIDGIDTIQEFLANLAEHSVGIISPQKGPKYAMVEMAYLNAEATFKKEKDADAIRERTLLESQERFRLTRYPRRIECCDISNISGTESVATLVAFTDGKKDAKRYRKYKIRSFEPSNDYAAMQEVLTRRFVRAREEGDLPDLFMVDGGKGHLNIAIKVLQELNVISVDLIAIAKEEGRHDRGMTMEQIFLPNLKDPIILKHNSPILFLLQQIRDEAHRTAITYQRKRRSKVTIRSAVEDISGIGPAKRKKLLRHFGSIKRIAEATPEELKQVKGLSDKDVKAVIDFLAGFRLGGNRKF
ncbi:MAG TPA: excinuclease ABC subunit UvrC, partial [Waddliaceae bacterium]